jgi:hypothetical protein
MGCLVLEEGLLGEHVREVQAAFPKCKYLLETAAAPLGAADWSRIHLPTARLESCTKGNSSRRKLDARRR